MTGIQQRDAPLHRWRYRVGAGALYATGRRQPRSPAHELTGRSVPLTLIALVPGRPRAHRRGPQFPSARRGGRLLLGMPFITDRLVAQALELWRRRTAAMPAWLPLARSVGLADASRSAAMLLRVGLTPKRLARLLRFERAVTLCFLRAHFSYGSRALPRPRRSVAFHPRVPPLHRRAAQHDSAPAALNMSDLSNRGRSPICPGCPQEDIMNQTAPDLFTNVHKGIRRPLLRLSCTRPLRDDRKPHRHGAGRLAQSCASAGPPWRKRRPAAAAAPCSTPRIFSASTPHARGGACCPHGSISSTPRRRPTSHAQTCSSPPLYLGAHA